MSGVNNSSRTSLAPGKAISTSLGLTGGLLLPESVCPCRWVWPGNSILTYNIDFAVTARSGQILSYSHWIRCDWRSVERGGIAVCLQNALQNLALNIQVLQRVEATSSWISWAMIILCCIEYFRITVENKMINRGWAKRSAFWRLKVWHIIAV